MDADRIERVEQRIEKLLRELKPQTIAERFPSYQGSFTPDPIDELHQAAEGKHGIDAIEAALDAVERLAHHEHHDRLRRALLTFLGDYKST